MSLKNMQLTWTSPTIKPMVAHHYSDAAHSAIVVAGGYREDGSVIPARDFFSDAIANTNFEITGDIESGFKEINEDLHTNIKASIASPQWQWNAVTYRRNGDVVESPRDIVDTGELLNSQHWEFA